MTEAMHVQMAAVMSVDGIIKKDTQVHTRDWISNEDKKLFDDLVSDSQVIIAGRKTYRNMRSVLSKDKQYVIYTHDPESFAAEASEFVTFTNDDPSKLMQDLQTQGFTKVLVVGGGAINAMFLQAGLVDEIFLTIEPVLHGAGKPLVEHSVLDTKLTLLKVTQLNTAGTVLLRYKVVK